MSDKAAAAPQGWSQGRRRVALIALAISYGLNVADRQLLSILAGPMKGDLHLSDTQLGVMGGVAFALFYATCSLPLAWLADRWSRANVIAIGLGLWSAFTAACGFAQTGLQLFLYRLGVGFGEAAGTAPSFSLISDYYPPNQRGRAIALLNFAAPLGVAMGPLAGALIASKLEWRAAFIIAGAFGLVFLPFFRWAVRDPSIKTRSSGVVAVTRLSAEARNAGLKKLFGRPTFWLMAVGTSLNSMVLNGLIFWLPSFLQRTYGLAIIERAMIFGLTTAIAGLIGVWLSGWLMDKLGGNRKLYVLLPALAGVSAIPFYMVGLNAPNVWIAEPFIFLGMILTFFYPTPIYQAVQHLVPAGLRSTSTASYLLINNNIGIGIGVLFLGFLSDTLAPIYGDQSLKYSIMASMGLYVFSALLLWVCSRSITRAWVD
jgi:MFS family permease